MPPVVRAGGGEAARVGGAARRGGAGRRRTLPQDPADEAEDAAGGEAAAAAVHALPPREARAQVVLLLHADRLLHRRHRRRVLDAAHGALRLARRIAHADLDRGERGFRLLLLLLERIESVELDLLRELLAHLDAQLRFARRQAASSSQLQRSLTALREPSAISLRAAPACTSSASLDLMLSFVGLSSSFAAPSRAAAATRCRAAQAAAAPQLREYEYDGWKLTYRHKAASPGREADAPLLLVHPIGIGLDSWFWEKFLGAWTGGDVYAPDLIGVGGGDAWDPAERGRERLVVVIQGCCRCCCRVQCLCVLQVLRLRGGVQPQNATSALSSINLLFVRPKALGLLSQPVTSSPHVAGASISVS